MGSWYAASTDKRDSWKNKDASWSTSKKEKDSWSTSKANKDSQLSSSSWKDNSWNASSKKDIKDKDNSTSTSTSSKGKDHINKAMNKDSASTSWKDKEWKSSNKEWKDKDTKDWKDDWYSASGSKKDSWSSSWWSKTKDEDYNKKKDHNKDHKDQKVKDKEAPATSKGTLPTPAKKIVPATNNSAIKRKVDDKIAEQKRVLEILQGEKDEESDIELETPGEDMLKNLLPMLEHYEYSKNDISRLIVKMEYDEVAIQKHVESILDTGKSTTADDGWNKVISKAEKKRIADEKQAAEEAAAKA